MYSCEYLRVRVQVLACDSRATRESCQVARERHCNMYMYMYYPSLSMALPLPLSPSFTLLRGTCYPSPPSALSLSRWCLNSFPPGVSANLLSRWRSLSRCCLASTLAVIVPSPVLDLLFESLVPALPSAIEVIFLNFGCACEHSNCS